MDGNRFDYAVFDIETTGLDPATDRICEIAAIGVMDGLPQETFRTLVNIGGRMPEAASKVNGITDAMLAGAPSIAEALEGFLSFIGDEPVLAGHNIEGFDLKFLIRAACGNGLSFPAFHAIDTLAIARELWPELESRSMDSFRKRLGIERTDAHRALADCYDELALLNAEHACLAARKTRTFYELAEVLGDGEMM